MKKQNIGRNAALVAGLVGTLALSGCISYRIAGQFEQSGTPFYGTVSVSMGGTGKIDVATLDGKVTCAGTSTVTKRPSLYSTVGGQGTATATCSDGTSFKIDFIQVRESGGHGQGIDSDGKIVKIFFDTSESRAKSNMQKYKIDSLVK